MAPGDFFATAQNLRLEDNHVLVGRLKGNDGEWHDVKIDLNEHIGNQNGRFCWDSEGFAASAQEIHLSIEGEGPVCVLRAKLRNDSGDYKDADLNLSERLANKDGTFAWSE